MENQYSLETQCARALFNDKNEAKIPISLSTLYPYSDYIYRRYNQNNCTYLKQSLKQMYSFNDYCYIVQSGLSALTLVLNHFLLNKYNRIIFSNFLHEECKELCAQYNSTEFVDINDVSINQGDLVLVEKISNPTLHDTNVKYICDYVHKRGGLVIVDNSMLSPIKYNPFLDGCDIVVDSLTKYAAGHGVCMLGAVLTSFNMNSSYRLFGFTPSPFDCWLASHEIITYSLRIAKHFANSVAIRAALQKYTPYVRYSDLSPVITCHLGDNDFHKKFCSYLKLFYVGASFGDCQSIIYIGNYLPGNNFDYPYNTFLRLSPGIENVDDLIKDLDDAWKCTNK